MTTPMTTPSTGSWLWAHIGRLAGVLLGLVAFAGLVMLAVAGYSAAYFLVALIVVGLVMIIVGGRIRGR